ncbi:MAG: phosphopantetheine-binding protein [Helicobacter sp.]|nr:phosphopantetheine-binding protein [Helicobacteraceae bacterium]MDY3114064.1 phosphopantetheine-binding protein [Helicobacter sp.]
MKEKILNFIKAKNPALKDNVENLPLFSAETLDSMGFLELLGELEECYKVEIDLSEYDPSEFDSVDKFVSLVESLVKGIK